MIIDNNKSLLREKNKEATTNIEAEEEKLDTITNIEKLLQKQVCHEFHNERLYLSMALWCEEKGYIETAKFFNIQSLEERSHGMDFINYMNKRKMKVNPPYEQPIEEGFNNLKSLLEAALKQEILTSTMIKEIHREALKSSDLALTIAFKYLEEQVEEEQLFNSLLNLYDLCDGSKIDFEMGISAIVKNNKYIIGNL